MTLKKLPMMLLKDQDKLIFTEIPKIIGKTIEKRLDAIDKIIIKLYSDNATGVLADDMLNKMVSNLSDETTKLKKQLAEIESKLSIGNDIISISMISFSVLQHSSVNFPKTLSSYNF